MSKLSYDLVLKTDGASRGNPGHSGIGGQLVDSDGNNVLTFSEYIGQATNNVAEYKALIFGLDQAAKLNAKVLLISLDSELLVKQMKGEYRVKNLGLKPLHAKAKALADHFVRVYVEHVFREENREADALANQAIDLFLSGDKEAFHDETPIQPGLFDQQML